MASEKRYRKTSTITARQWFKMGDHPAVVPIIVTERDPSNTSRCLPNQTPPPNVSPNRYEYHPGMEKTHGYISTLEGGHIVSPGDWIATGVRGEHWAIKPDIFSETYKEDSAAADEVGRLRRVAQKFIDDVDALRERSNREKRVLGGQRCTIVLIDDACEGIEAIRSVLATDASGAMKHKENGNG